MRAMQIYALSKEYFVKFFNFIACSKQALGVPELLEVMVACPLIHVLVLVRNVHLHAVIRRKMLIQLLFSD